MSYLQLFFYFYFLKKYLCFLILLPPSYFILILFLLYIYLVNREEDDLFFAKRGAKAIGSFVDVCFLSSDLDTDMECWKVCKIVGHRMDRNKEEHNLRIIPPPSTSVLRSWRNDPNNEEMEFHTESEIGKDDTMWEWHDACLPLSQDIWVCLDDRVVEWLNVEECEPKECREYKEQVEEHFKKEDSDPTHVPASTHGIRRLKFSLEDLGLRVKIFWPKMQNWYLGTIIRYRYEETGQTKTVHSVLFDDGDFKSYDLNSRDYIIMDRIPPLDISLVPDLDRNLVPTRVLTVTRPKQATILYATKPQGSDAFSMSLLQVININHFGQQGGFSAIESRLSDRDPVSNSLHPESRPLFKCSTSLTCMLLRLLSACRRVLQPSIQESLARSLCKPALETLLNMSPEEMRSSSQSDVEDVVRSVGELMMYSDSLQKQLCKELDVFFFQLSIKQLQCNQLAKRLVALSTLSEFISSVCPQALPQRSLTSSYTSSRTAHASVERMKLKFSLGYYGTVINYIRGEHVGEELVDWLLNQNILEIVFNNTSGLHVEVIKRSSAILRFIALKNKLTAWHIQCVWESVRRQHESVLKVALSTLSDLVPMMKQQHRRHLFSQVCLIPKEEFNESILEFVHHFTLAAYEADCIGPQQVSHAISQGQLPFSLPQKSQTLTSEASSSGSPSSSWMALSGIAPLPSPSDGTRRGSSPGVFQWYGVELLWNLVQVWVFLFFFFFFSCKIPFVRYIYALKDVYKEYLFVLSPPQKHTKINT